MIYLHPHHEWFIREYRIHSFISIWISSEDLEHGILNKWFKYISNYLMIIHMIGLYILYIFTSETIGCIFVSQSVLLSLKLWFNWNFVFHDKWMIYNIFIVRFRMIMMHNIFIIQCGMTKMLKMLYTSIFEVKRELAASNLSIEEDNCLCICANILIAL